MRDHIPKIIKESGKNPSTYILSQEEYRRALHRKLYEETNELIEASEEERLIELSDIYEVITCLAEEIGFSESDLINAAYKKRKTNGSFKNRFYLVAVGDVDLSEVLDRFGSGWPKVIDCDQGWYGIIHDIDAELSAIDPHYKIQQIKEKFGGLRYYCVTKIPDVEAAMRGVIRKYEQVAWVTCESTGNPGVLMKRDLWYKTLDPAVAPAGFTIVNREKLLNDKTNS